MSGYETKRREYDQDIEELARLRRELARIESDCVLEKAREELAKAGKRAKAIEELHRQDEAAGLGVALAKAGLENISNRWTRRQELIEVLAREEAAWNSAREVLANLEAEAGDIAGQFAASEEALVTATKTTSDAEMRSV